MSVNLFNVTVLEVKHLSSLENFTIKFESNNDKLYMTTDSKIHTYPVYFNINYAETVSGLK